MSKRVLVGVDHGIMLVEFVHNLLLLTGQHLSLKVVNPPS